MAATLVGFTGWAVAAAEPDPFLLFPEWHPIFTVRSGAGYKDNIFLSHDSEQRSAFVSGGAELFLLRLAPTGPQFTLFADVSALHYFSASSSQNEYTAFGQTLLEQQMTDNLKLSLGSEYFFQDQFLDVSVSETNRAAVDVRGHTIAVKPAARYELSAQFWISLEADATRQFFAEPLDDYWQLGPEITFGRSFGYDSRVSLGYEPAWRFYDTDPARLASGQPIPGTKRRRFEHDSRLQWRHHWDEEKKWRTTLTGGVRVASENGGGFSDFTRWLASARVQYRAAPWEFSVEGRVARYDYHEQTVNVTDLSKRRRTEWSAGARVERQIGEHLKIIASYQREETSSNDPFETYTVNTVSTLLQWEF